MYHLVTALEASKIDRGFKIYNNIFIGEENVELQTRWRTRSPKRKYKLNKKAKFIKKISLGSVRRL